MSNYCNICPNKCNALRTESNLGRCRATNDIKIAKYYLHPFEEPIISGKNGSGTIFFTGCALRCVFCQNYELSRNLRGKTVTPLELANIFKELEDKGAHNINLVTPSHYTYQIIKALDIYKPNIPIIYNTHGYELISTLKDIEPYIDVFLPDLKFKSPTISKRYALKEDYFKYASESILFMMNAKKTVIENGLIKSGVIVRHLILPLCFNYSIEIVNLFKQITISIESANNLIVLKTISGNASAAGMAIDEIKFPQIIGTVAGDDTLLIITKTSADAEIVVKGLEQL